MSKKVIAFSGSNSSTSINQQLVHIAAGYAQGIDVEVIDLRDYPAPLYGIDLEKAEGVPQSIQELKAVLDGADGFLISSPEHNGSIPTFFKNTIDWLSRIKSETKTFGGKPLLAMSTSPGANGGKTNLTNLLKLLPFWGANVVGSFSLGGFYNQVTEGQLADEPAAELKEAVQNLATAVNG